MPAGFNKGQIEYIKTIANVNGHKTYKNTTVANANHNSTVGSLALNDPMLRYYLWCLGDRPLVYNPTSPNVGVIENAMNPIDVYNVQINTNRELADHQQRVTPECFLESVRMKMRIIQNLDVTDDVNSHKEYRLIIFRHREKQSSVANLAHNFSNPMYDMFHGAGNYKYGPEGFRNKMDDAGHVNYMSWGGYTTHWDRDAMLTDPMNKEDYVVAKDCRFYLGREYGGKHIFEDTMHWDHEDPIATDQDKIDLVDSTKNYCWYIMLMGVNNQVPGVNGAPTVIDDLGYVSMRFNTYVTSG